MITVPLDEVRPTYSIYRFLDGVYKVVKFCSTAPVYVPHAERCKKGNTDKLAASLSRARRNILELALCNDWTYFVTLTLSKENGDRFDLNAWYKSFTEWLRYQRKLGYHISYVLVPERHDKGSWHMHGLMNIDMPVVSFRQLRYEGNKVPSYLVDNSYLNWPAYQQRFGFCSLSTVRNHVAVSYYITKYVTKDMARCVSDVGSHMVRSSVGLNRPTKHGDIYQHVKYLDTFLDHVYDFCSTGMTQVKDGLDWTFALEYMELEPWNVSDPESQAVPELVEVDNYVEFTQMYLNNI